MMKTIITFKLLVLVMAAFGFIIDSNGCKKGRVIEKFYQPAYQEEVESYSVQMDAPMTEIRRYPARYLLRLQSDDEACQCEVSPMQYAKYQIGEHIVL